MAYKKDDNGGQAAASASPASSSSGSSTQSFGGNYSPGGGKGKSSVKASVGSRDSSAHAAASADRAAAAKRGKVTAFTPSVRGGASSKPGASFSPAYVGKNPYQWGNNEGIVNHWHDDDPERQAKLDALGFAADDPDRSFHYYEPDKGSDKSYLERANSLNIDRNFFQAGNFWNTIDGPYESEDARKSDAAQWMLDAQTYGKWAKDHGLTYADENGETRDMADAWKDIWDYANEITGGIGDSESTRAGRDIEAYLTGGEYDSTTTQKLLDQAKYFADNAESEKDASRWADYEKSLRIQLEADQKKEKKDNSFLGKIVNAFDRPERAEQGELTDTQKAYQQAAAEDQLYSGWATDPLSAAAFAPIAEKRDELAEQVKAENRAAGREVYTGMEDEDRLADATESWLGGRGAGAMAGVAGGLYAVDSAFYDNDEIRQLTQQQWQADQAFLTTGDPKFKEESEALQVQIDEAQQRAIENGESGTPLADPAGMLLESAKGMQDEADQKWQDVTEDMSAADKMAANVAKTGADVAADVVENAIAPGVGTMRMYLGAGGSGALEQAGRENNDPDSIAAATVSRAASAWLSTKLVGGMEGVYGKSILGGITDDMISGASPATQAAIKTLLNTEGVEEGLEDILNYGADLVLGLSPEERLQWDEVGQDAFVGYVLGVLTNGLSAGINYDSKARHELAEEALEFARSGMSIEEAAEIAKETTKDQVVMKPPSANEAQNRDMADSQNAALESQEQNVASAPVNQEPQNQNLAEGQAAALAGQDQNPAPAPQRAANGPDANTEPYTGPELPGASYGGGTTVKVGKTKVPVHFAVVPISELNVSHDIYGNRNQNYPGELQPRDRSRGTAQNQAIEIGTNLDPGELEWSNNATTGAPIIRPDGTVISGNGRTNGIGYALETGRGGEYTQYLRDNAERFGIDPNSVGDDSVLVRVADGDYNWQAMAEQANVSDVSRMSTTEQAGVDAERLSRYSEILDKLVPNDTGDLNTSDNADFVKEFLQAVVPTSEQGSVWTEKGGLSQEGKRRVENAVFQMAYGDASLMARLSESLDNNMKNVSNSLLALAPKVATLENNVTNGTRYIGIRDTLLEGVNIFEEAKNRGVDVGKVVDQISMDNNASPEAVFIAEFLQDNAKSAKQIRTFLNAMADTAEDFGDPTQIGFFDTGDTEYTSKDVLEGAIARYEQETGNQLGRPDYDFYGDVFDTGADREGEGTDSAEADAAADRASPGIGEDTGSGERGGLTELASRMLDGDVSDEEYLSLMETEDGRAQLAAALGLPNSDTKTVANGLSLYLIFQDQLRQSVNQQTETRAPRYGEEGFIDPMGEDIEEDSDEDNRPPLDDLLAEMEEEENASSQQNNDAAGILLGEEVETPQNVQGNPEGVNSQAEETNSTTGVLNAQETAGNANPEQNTQNNPLLDSVVEALNNRNGPNVSGNANANQNANPAEKVSEVSTNTLAREEGENYRGDLTYTPHPQEQLILDAYARIGENPGETVRDLMKPGMWTDEQVKAGKIVRDTLYQQAASTGDYTAYDAWRKVTQEHSTPVAQSLAAMRADPELSAERVYDNANKFLDDAAAGEASGVGKVDQKVIEEAKKNVADVTGELAALELEQKKAVKSGKTPKQAWEQVKGRYLDLADQINSIRHVGLIQDAGKNAAIRKGQRDVDTNLHDLLGEETEDYIKRYVNLAAAGIANDVKYRGKVDADKVAKYVNGLQKLCQLATTGTTLRNLEGNTSFGVFNWASNNTAGVVLDQLMSLFTGQRSLGFEAGIFGKRERMAAKTAARRSVLEIAANMDLLDNGGTKYGVTGNLSVNPYTTNPVNRFYARAQQGLSYALNTTDAWFFGMQQESAANAAKRVNKKLTDEQAQAIGRQAAEYGTFKNDTFISNMLEGIQAAVDVIGWGGEVTRKGRVPVQRKGGFGLGTLMAPYIKVPVNIGLKAAEFSPIGGAVGAVNAARAISAARAGDADAVLMQNQAAAQMGRGVFGTGVMLALAALMREADWFKNWNDEDDPDVKAQNKAEGKFGLQVNLDMLRNVLQGKPQGDWSSGKKMNIDAIEPLNQVLAEASMIADWNEGITVNALKNAVITGTLDSMRDLPAISSITTIADTMTYNPVYTEDEEGNREKDMGATVENAIAAGIGNSLSGFVPGAVRHAARIADEYDRDTSGDTAVEQAVNQFKAAVPKLRESLPVKTDNFGNPVSAGSLGTRVANNLLANKYNDVEQGELSKEIERLRNETGVSVMPSKNGPSTVRFGDETAHLSSGERKEWKDESGHKLDTDASIMTRSRIYKDADDDLRTVLWKELQSYVKDDVKAEFAKDNGYDFEKKYGYLDDVDNPITFLTANKAFNYAESKDDYDVVDDLIGPVSRLTQDEQELMRDKNSTLMNYYDYLTPNDRGYKVKDAETVREYKTGAKANAEARNKKSPSGQDKFNAVYNGYLDKTFSDGDIDAIMSKAKTTEDEETGEETVRWDITKGRAAIYLAMRAGGASVREALDATKNADVDNDNTIDEKGVKIKAEYEGTNALKRYGSGNDAMWYEFNEIMYPWKNRK